MIEKIDMTKQEMFDKSVGGLIEQGCVALDRDGNCRYRTEEGHKCAFGQLIPNELYEESMEKQFVYGDAFKAIFTQNVIDFGVYLQRIHDGCRYFDDILEEYKELAIAEGLSLEIFDGN